MLEPVFNKRIGHMVLMMQQIQKMQVIFFFFWKQIKRSCCDVSLLLSKAEKKIFKYS